MTEILLPILLAFLGVFLPMLAVFGVMSLVEWLGLFD